jgi:hypothetical protein
MPTTGLRQEFKLETRNRYTTVDAEIGFKVNGKELPSMAVLGAAVEEAIELIQTKIAESYKVVPERVDTPVADPYKRTDGS